MIGAPVRAAPTPIRERLQALWPLSSGPAEIRCLDGLRAIAALSVLFLHAFHSVGSHASLFGLDVSFAWSYGQTGVHLFFVLSGFLLFLPYVRAMVAAHPLPSARSFYRRRALRILPAYWVCLTVLVLLHLPMYASLAGLEDIASHIALLHDDFYAFNRSIEGPFWTLAVEVQFYLLLPLMASVIARLVGSTRSVWRMAGGVVGVTGLALLVREIDAYGQARLPTLQGGAARVLGVFLQVTMGGQGKYLEVFAVGMLCSVLYVAATEQGKLGVRTTRWLSAALLTSGLAAAFVLARWVYGNSYDTPPYFIVNQPRNLAVICGPLLVGASYGAIVLAALWGIDIVRAPFEARPLRFIGLISYSLYLWHQPIIFAAAPLTTRLPLGLPLIGALAVGFVIAVPTAYASYQLVERPFLKRQRMAVAMSVGRRADTNVPLRVNRG